MAGAPRGPYAPSAVRPHTETVVPVYAYAPVVMTPEEETKYWLLGQIEYYFSVDNLCRDMFLRQKVRPSLFLLPFEAAKSKGES